MLLVRSSEFGSDSVSAAGAISAVMDVDFGLARFLTRVRGVAQARVLLLDAAMQLSVLYSIPEAFFRKAYSSGAAKLHSTDQGRAL